MVADKKDKGKASKGTQKSAWDGLTDRLAQDKNGWLHLGVAAAVCLVLSAALYWPLSWPARLLTGLVARVADGSCASATTGGSFAYWACGSGLSLIVTIGSIMVVFALFLLRQQVRAGTRKAMTRLPPTLSFLERPVVTTLVFILAWAGIQFHFFTRWGFIIDGLFPAFVGILMFALTWWETPIKNGLGPAWGVRDRLPKIARIAGIIAIPVLLAYAFTGWMPYGLRDQLVALMGVFAGWFLFTPSPGGAPHPPRRRSKGATTALALLTALAILLVVATTVSAADPCNRRGWLTEEFFACEAAHHNGTFGATGAVIGIGTTAVVLAPSREEETEEATEEAAPANVDPCIDLQGAYDGLRGEWMQMNDFIQSQEKFLQAREHEYRVRNESTFWSQATDVAFMGASLASSGTKLAGTALGRVAQAAGDALKPIVVSEILKQAMVEGGTTNAMEVAYAIVNKTSSGAYGKQHEALLQQLQKTIVEDMGDKLAAAGVPKGSQQYASIILKANHHAQELVEGIGGIAKVGSGGVGLWNMFSQYQSLDDFRKRIHKLRLALITKRADLDMMMDSLQDAKYDLEHCRERVAMGLDP